MKKIFYLLFLLPVLVSGQDQNYVKKTAYKVPTADGITATDGSGAVTDAKKIVQKTFFDGLGRPIQQVAYQQSGTGTDIVTCMGYDGFGRQTKDYMPYANSTASLNYNPNAMAETLAFYNTSDYGYTTNPYSEKLFDNSSLNRVIKQASLGTDWMLPATAGSPDHSIKLDYGTNIANEVKFYKANASATAYATNGYYTPALTDAGFYAAGDLYKTVTKDENWTTLSGNNNTTEEFKDKEGHVLLKRTYNAAVKHDTYYIYDQYGNLSYVLPPLLASITTQLDGLCYQYRYDYRNRLVEKKLPGKQWEFIVYDRLDRVVATGPALSPFSDTAAGVVGWLVTKYDVLNRPVYTGWQQLATVTSADRKALQDVQNALATTPNETKLTSGTIDGIAAYYSNLVAPTSFKLLSVNYYDNYTFPAVAPIPASVETQTVLTATQVRTLPTGSWARACTTTVAITGETNTIFYDAKARPVRNYSKNYLGGYTQVDSRLNFTGMPLYTITTHKRLATDTEIKVTDTFTYTDQDRLLTHSHQIGTGTIQFLARNEYNKMGQLIKKSVGNPIIAGATGLQVVNYRYNVRGWLTDINNVDNLTQGLDPQDLFAFRINYNGPVTGGITGVKELYNGNIAETFWRTSSDDRQRKYGYEYDDLNRLLNATYQKPGTAAPNSYKESMTYDKNGNIKTLARNGGLDSDQGLNALEIDNLVYTYSSGSNRLATVTDSSLSSDGFNDGNTTGTDYTYDTNGNMVKDLNKKIGTSSVNGITYNHLNLPVKIVFNNDPNTRIEYIYNANGEKLQKTVYMYSPPPSQVVPINNVTDYLDGFQYKDAVLKFFPTAEGYVNNTVSAGANVYNYVYNYTDHLGNVRLSYGLNAANVLKILEENHYYPFGLKHSSYNSEEQNYARMDTGNVSLKAVVAAAPLAYQYKYNGKELQDELGLNLYDYGARNYDPAIGRWMNIDPLAEKYKRWSAYNYAMDNPVKFTDPDGKRIRIGKNDYSYVEDRNYDSIKNDFERQTYQALDLLYASKAMEVKIDEGENAKTVNILDELIKDKKTIKIKEGKDNTYSFKKNVLTFNPSQGIAFFKDANNPYSKDSGGNTIANYGKNSPASILSHELLHGYNDFFDKNASKRLSDTSTAGKIIDPYGRDFSFPNAEEKFTTTLVNQVNEHLGEEQRTNYGIVPYSVKSPTTTEPTTTIPLQ